MWKNEKCTQSSFIHNFARTFKIHRSSSMREENPREKWWQIKLIFFLFHQESFPHKLNQANAYLGNTKIKFVGGSYRKWNWIKKCCGFFVHSTVDFFHLTLIFPSHTNTYLSLNSFVCSLSMQMVELILPVVRETRTYTGRRENRANIHFWHLAYRNSEEFMDIKIVCTHNNNATLRDVHIWIYDNEANDNNRKSIFS